MTKTKTKTKSNGTKTLNVSRKLHEKLKLLAAIRGKKLEEVANEAIGEYLLAQTE